MMMRKLEEVSGGGKMQDDYFCYTVPEGIP